MLIQFRFLNSQEAHVQGNWRWELSLIDFHHNKLKSSDPPAHLDHPVKLVPDRPAHQEKELQDRQEKDDQEWA